MNIIEQLKWRYAIKKFDSTKILSSSKVKILKEAFNLTASSFGLQPIKLVLVSNPKIKQQLVPLTMDQPQVGQASHVGIICVEKHIKTEYIKTYFERVKTIRNTPDEILDPFKQMLIDDFESKSHDEIEAWATKQAYIALGTMLTVCAAEAIDACPIEGFNPTAYDEFFNFEEKGLKSVLVLALGYRAEDDMFAGFKKVRKGVKSCVIEVD